MASAYVTLEEAREAIGTGVASDDRLLQLALNTASRWIDKHCGRVFYASEAATVRIYTPEWRDLLLIDDATVVTKVEIDRDDKDIWSEITSSNWTTEPKDSDSITSLRIRGWSTEAFTDGYRVRVTGTFGHPLVDEAKQACLFLLGRYFKRKDAPFGIAGSADTGIMRLPRRDPDVEALLAPYVRMDLRVG